MVSLVSAELLQEITKKLRTPPLNPLYYATDPKPYAKWAAKKKERDNAARN